MLEARQAALSDPIGFVERLQRGETLDLPGPIQVAEIPDIDWTKYDILGEVFEDFSQENLLILFFIPRR